MTLIMEGIALNDPLRALIEQKLAAVAGRGRPRPISARIGFTDENGPKGGIGVRCALTVELPRRAPAHAEAVAEAPRSAFDGALAALGRELEHERRRRRDIARRPKKYFVARQGLQPDGEAALPPARRRRPS